MVPRLFRFGLLATSLGLCGCASSLHLDRSTPSSLEAFSEPAVYVTNPGLQREHAILQAANIYPLTKNPDAARRLTLRPIHQSGRCGNPLMLSFITLGLVPGYLPGAYEFVYDLEQNGRMQTYSHRLPIYERFSIWERFVHENPGDVLAEALRRSHREPWGRETVPDLTTTGSQ